MGAEQFIHPASGDTAEEAFRRAVDEAAYDHGHAGYTGTIAEKSEFTMIELPDDYDAEEYAELLMSNDDERIDDKWGPAGCIAIDATHYLFFGWASS